MLVACNGHLSSPPFCLERVVSISAEVLAGFQGKDKIMHFIAITF